MRARRSALPFVLCWFGLSAPALAAGPSAADDAKRACAGAFDQAQSLRRDGKLADARERLAFCSRDECPRLVRVDCASMMIDVVASQPTVVLGARDEHGQDLSAVSVALDGKPLASTLDGKPVTVDPGTHSFRFTREDGAAAEESVVVLAGQKNRVVEVTFAPPAPPPAVAAAPAALQPVVTATDVPPTPMVATVEPLARSTRTWHPPLYGWIIGGAGIGVLAAALVLDISTTAQINDLSTPGGCAPNCPQSTVDALRTRYIVSGVLAGVGVASLGVAALVLFTPSAYSSTPPRASARLDLAPVGGGALARVVATF